MIILQFLNRKSMHGYMVIAEIRRSFGICLRPSSVYSLLAALEESGYIEGEWKTNSLRPRKVYSLTIEGQRFLNFTEDSLKLVCKDLLSNGKVDAITEIAQNKTRFLTPDGKTLNKCVQVRFDRFL